MARAKLILICQCGGEFVVKDDGTMSYVGGDAHAVDINHETLIDDLKLKLAEMCNLECKSLSIKYFLPGNRRTLISLSSDKDLRRMYEFHGNAVTADVFVMGKAGFDAEEALNTLKRACGIKLAETVTPTLSGPRPESQRAAGSLSSAKRTQRPSRLAHTSDISPAFTDHTDPTSSVPASASADTSVHDMDVSDMDSTPADTVKKRRRTAAWRIGPNGPTIASVQDDIEDGRNTLSPRKKNTFHYEETDDEEDQEQETVQSDDSNSSDQMQDILGRSNDLPSEELITSWKSAITGVGQEFTSVQEFRDVLQKYAIAHRFMYKFKKNDTNRASCICTAEACSWRIHASKNLSVEKFIIKKMEKTHTCAREFGKVYQTKRSWLVSIIKDKLTDNPHLKPKEVTDCILQDFGVTVNCNQARRGIEDAKEQLLGSYKEAYNQLPWFCEKMTEANPGSNIKLSTDDDGRFKRLFECFHASIHGFQNGCRPILFLDSMSLRSKHHEMFFVASALDGDDGVFPVAFAIVDSENGDNWLWFLEQLKDTVSATQSLTFVFDREKGLKKPVTEVFENAHIGYSMHHLLRNFKKSLRPPFHGEGKGSLLSYFVAAAQSLRQDGFRFFTDQIKQVSLQAYDWVLQIEPECWTNVSFKGEHHNHITADVGETYTNWIEETRALPIIRKVEVLTSKLMELINNRRTCSSTWSTTQLTPSKEKKLEQNILQARSLKVIFSTDTLFEVHNGSINVVDINKSECSCLDWKATGIPCSHVIAVFNCTGKNVYDYCSRYYKVENFRSTYSESVNHVVLMPAVPSETLNGETIDSKAQNVLPPSYNRPQRQGEENPTKKRKGVAKKEVYCSNCKEPGHNKATCKA